MKAFKLDNHKITPGFIVPDGYFEALAAKVAQQMPQQETKVIPLASNRKSWIFAAAAILVLSLMIPALNSISFTSNEPDLQALENYLTYHSTISDAELVDLLESEDIEKISIDYQLEDKAIEDELTSNSNLEHYISN